MSQGLTSACEVFAGVLAGTDPELFSGADCAVIVERLARLEKCMAGRRLQFAARAISCEAHKERGFSDPVTWLAQQSGISSGAAKSALQTASRLDACPETREAVLAGEVSLGQAEEITKTEKAVPGSERALLNLATHAGVGELKDECRRRRQRTQDREKQHEQQHRERYFRHWIDDQGLIHIRGAFTPEVGVQLVNRVDAEADRLIRAAKHDRADPGTREQVGADALANLILQSDGTGGARPRGRGAELVLVCDITAFHRGDVEGDERCHVIGGGLVPVSVAQDLAHAGAFIKAVTHRGKQIDTVAHFGRYLNAELLTVLGLGEAPLFQGRKCVDCGKRYWLERDHVDPVNNHGLTSYDNLRDRCKACHWDKTERDRLAGLLTPRDENTDQDPTGPTGPPNAPARTAVA